jgi:hypothetical protein
MFTYTRRLDAGEKEAFDRWGRPLQNVLSCVSTGRFNWACVHPDTPFLRFLLIIIL